MSRFDFQAPIRVLVVRPGATPEVLGERVNDGSVLHALVGGWIEAVSGDGWVMWLDEEGKNRGLPLNEAATRFALERGALAFPGDYIAGPAVVTGVRQIGGEYGEVCADVPATVLAAFGIRDGSERASGSKDDA
jgi:hypothetical protein